MKARLIAVVVLGCASLLWAQSTTPQTTPPSAQSQTGAGTAKGTQKGYGEGGYGEGGYGGMGMRDMGAMHAQHLQEMKATMQKMHTLLDQMKSSISGMDAKDQPAMQANLQMWQMMVEHLDKMVQHMSEGAGPRGMHHRHGGMQGGPPPSSGTGGAPGTGTPPK